MNQKKAVKKPPIICIVGAHNIGKTTFLVKLISELKSRGCRVGIVKHHRGEFDIDHPGKDTYRHAQAGADSVFISSPTKLAMVRKMDREAPLDLMSAMAGDVDIILAEGYKGMPLPQIEVFRSSVGTGLVGRRENLIAVVCDIPLDIEVKCFSLDDFAGVADLLEENFLQGV